MPELFGDYCFAERINPTELTFQDFLNQRYSLLKNQKYSLLKLAAEDTKFHDKLKQILSQKPVFGDKLQIEAMKAYEFIQIGLTLGEIPS